jgi:hypothetical protein
MRSSQTGKEQSDCKKEGLTVRLGRKANRKEKKVRLERKVRLGQQSQTKEESHKWKVAPITPITIIIPTTPTT